jgi:adenylate cyclase
MKYRAKLYLAFSGLALFSTLFALGIVYIDMRSHLFEELQSKVISIAATTAAAINPDLLAQVRSTADAQSPAYLEIQDLLQRIRNANRRDDVHIQYLYTVLPEPDAQGRYQFGVDSEEDPDIISHVGDEIDISPKKMREGFLHTYASDELVEDQWGEWLTGYAPIFDHNGQFVGGIGADIGAQEVREALRMILLLEVPALLVSLLVATASASFLSRRATTSLSALCDAVNEVGQGHFNKVVHLETRDEFHDLAEAVNHMAKGLGERERLKQGFARYVSSYVMEKILKSGGSMKLEGERKKVTVLFSDIRHFTALAEKLPPEQVVSLLNEYFEVMLEAIFSHQGMLDKFIGDGIMAEFGTPLFDPDQEKNAVLAALEMQEKLGRLDKRWAAAGKPVFQMGIGIHTGPAIVGNIGSEERMEYTAIGDTVNVASRLQVATKELGVQIIVSQATRQALGVEFRIKDLGSLLLPGRTGEISAYSIEGKT